MRGGFDRCAAVLVAAAGITALISKNEAQRVPPPVQQSVDSVKQDIQTVREAAS
jgi:hypothetical protein